MTNSQERAPGQTGGSQHPTAKRELRTNSTPSQSAREQIPIPAHEHTLDGPLDGMTGPFPAIHCTICSESIVLIDEDRTLAEVLSTLSAVGLALRVVSS